MLSLVYPASINLHSDPSWKKSVLFAHVPGRIIPAHIIFEVRNQEMARCEMLHRFNCKLERTILDVPLFASDGDLIIERWNCVSTTHPIGMLFCSDTFDIHLICASHFFPILSAYCCVAVAHETLNSHIKHGNLSSDKMLSCLQDSIRYEFPSHMPSPCLKDNSEDEFSFSRMREKSAAVIKDEHPVGMTREQSSTNAMLRRPTIMPEYSATCTVEHDLAYLLPPDPFGMGLSDTKSSESSTNFQDEKIGRLS